jgi:hypothetical protein
LAASQAMQTAGNSPQPSEQVISKLCVRLRRRLCKSGRRLWRVRSRSSSRGSCPFSCTCHFLVVLLANILRAPFVALGRLAPVLALPRELVLFLVGEVLAWRQRGRHGWRWWRLHTDVRRTIRRRRWRARWMVDNALEPRLTWKLIVGRPNGTRRTFERSWMALCMIPRPTEGHTTKGCGRWAAIVVRPGGFHENSHSCAAASAPVARQSTQTRSIR